MPWSRMNSRFSISLIPYFVRYRRSRCRSRSHGNSVQSKQNGPVRRSHRRIRQFSQDLKRTIPGAAHPRQGFFCRRYARQIPQFIPQGAIIVGSEGGVVIAPTHVPLPVVLAP